MNILIDIGHPAHVHLYRNTYFELQKRGHMVSVTVKDIPIAKKLLEHYGIPYLSIGEKYDSLLSKGWGQLKNNLSIWRFVRKNKIELGLGTSMTLAHISAVTKMKSIILDDDDDAVEPLFVKYGHPFCDVVLSPQRTPRKTPKAIFIDSYHELAYLHPNHFTPNPEVLNYAGLKQGEPYFILRFNAFKAHHDKGEGGLSIEYKRKLVKMLSAHGKVFITTERNIDKEFKEYQLSIPPEKIHSFIYYATMLVGDSQTMTSEAAVLGTPAIRCNTFVDRIHYLNEEEKCYGLTYGFHLDELEQMFKKIEELISMSDLKTEWKYRREKLLNEKIDYTKFLTWFVENYPESEKIMRENPDYQLKFK